MEDDDARRESFFLFCKDPMAQRLRRWQLETLRRWPWGPEVPTQGTYRAMAAALMAVREKS